MRKLILAAALAATLPGMAVNTYMMAPAEAQAPVHPDSTGFKFTDVKINKTTPVKNQNKSGTCWCFSGTSVLEEDVLRKGGPELDLSEMFTVRQMYLDKAKRYIMTHGATSLSQGGGFPDVVYSLKKYGVVPEEVYAGLNYGEEKHSHGEISAAIDGYMKAIGKNRKLSTAWLNGFEGILDAYFGKVPETFTYKGKTYTPQSFAKEIGLNADEYVNFTSFTHHPFYEEFALEIPDNWLWERSINVPMEELKEIVDNAINNGYTVGWAADVSEGGFQWKNGFALNPEPKKAEDLEGTELSRWVKLSDAEKANETNKIKGPVKEKKVTQEMRQQSFENYSTTDDHGMVIVGIAKDQAGNQYYKVKNSWDTNQIYNGYIYVSVPYFLEKTLSIMLNKGGVPAKIAKKANMK